ncbi:transposase family protein [Nonomuraea sp. CA-141351]|uniref:transposase family protein n=1 Tax=Nonomuraea sp. CA-141351 TaxID=3239996 RepID=UPI003D94E6E5
MLSSRIDVLARQLEHVTDASLPADLLDLTTLAEVLDAVPDPRSHWGRRYRLGPLLALSLLAVLGGATSLTKIARFVAGYNPARPAGPGRPTRRGATGRQHPGTAVRRLDGDAFDTATCIYLAALAFSNVGPELVRRPES